MTLEWATIGLTGLVALANLAADPRLPDAASPTHQVDLIHLAAAFGLGALLADGVAP